MSSNWAKDIIKDAHKEVIEKEKERKEEVNTIREHQKKLTALVMPVLRHVGDELYGHSTILRKPLYKIEVTLAPYHCRWELISKGVSGVILRLYCPGLQEAISASILVSHYKRTGTDDYNWKQVEGMQIAYHTVKTEKDVKELLKEPIREIIKVKALYKK